MQPGPFTRQGQNFSFAAGAAVLLLLIMGFIDEGKYNFSFLLEKDSLVTLATYLTAMLLAEALLYFFLLKKIKGFTRIALSFLLSIPLAMLFISLAVMFMIH